MPDDGPYDRNM